MKMKEKRSKGPQIWRLRQPQLFHTDVKKLPPMADTLSFNWKRNVRMSVWVSLFLSNRKLLFSQLCFPAQSANKESDFPVITIIGSPHTTFLSCVGVLALFFRVPKMKNRLTLY